MTKCSFEYSYTVGKLYDRRYQIGVRADQNLNKVTSFAVVLFYSQPNGERVQIARIDDTSHEDETHAIHIDRLYREADAPRKDFDIEVDTVFEADKYLSDHWRQFAQQFKDAHNR